MNDLRTKSSSHMTFNHVIDKSHFKSFNHLEKTVKEKFPNMTSKELRAHLRKRLKDKKMKSHQTKPYAIKIFSSYPNCWFHDLLNNGENELIKYWHVFIGCNNRFAVVKPLPNKSASAINKTLTEFINEERPVKLTSDEEPAFLEKGNLDLCTANNVSVRIVTEKNHSSLGIIDRFIRTLRDMNTPSGKSDKQSDDKKYRSFDQKRMHKLINIYNNTYHSSIKCSPREMKDDPTKEKDYIFKHLEKRDRQKEIEDFELKPGTFVRFILPRADGYTKKRYQTSKECYKIEGKDGMMYTLMAQDGTVKTLPRYRLFPVKGASCKYAKTFGENWNGVISKIIEYDKKKNKYKVEFKVPGKPNFIDWIPPRNLRGNWPQRLSKIEKDLSFRNDVPGTYCIWPRN